MVKIQSAIYSTYLIKREYHLIMLLFYYVGREDMLCVMLVKLTQIIFYQYRFRILIVNLNSSTTMQSFQNT